MSETPEENEGAPEDDPTRVVARRRAERVSHEVDDADDATRVVARGGDERAHDEADEATRALMRPAADGDEDDLTRIAAPHLRPPIPERADRDAARAGEPPAEGPGAGGPRRAEEPRPRGGRALWGRGIPRPSQSPAPPVPEPARPVSGAGVPPGGIAGLGDLTYVAASRIYPARQAPVANEHGPDAVLQRIGPPPGGDAPPAITRPEMPSLARDDRRRRLTTLGGYAAAIVVSATGLWIIARIAFG